jgi:two-component system nitrogen regulation sensor histidine kinase NtrY
LPKRLQRRFGKQITEGEAIFEQLTGTIVRQVGDLRNIVDEFSAFARMPKPVFKTEDIADIIGHSMFLLEVGHPDIQFEFTPPKTPLSLVCDRRQLGQAITNILKNAVESIEESSSSVTGKIFINLTQADSFIQISVTDNGPGLPADRERILEPYVTTRQTGSGLGLAIVQKIIEEHFAEIRIEDALGGGAVVTMQFSPDLIAERTQQAPEI